MIETLMAYECHFEYKKRCNKHYEEQKEAIKRGERPEYSFEQFIEDYKGFTELYAVGYSNRAISFGDNRVNFIDTGDYKQWIIKAGAGQEGLHMQVVKKDNRETIDYPGQNTASLFDNMIFIYEGDNGVVAIFHRRNGSGCKSVFHETANKMLDDLGYRLEMVPIVPTQAGHLNTIVPLEIELSYNKIIRSTDIADNIEGRKENVKKVIYNLQVVENRSFKEIIKEVIEGNTDPEDGFALLFDNLEDDEEGEAIISVLDGKSHRRVSYDEINSFIGSYDITDEMNIFRDDKQKLAEKLLSLANNYYEEIRQSTVLDNVITSNNVERNNYEVG